MFDVPTFPSAATRPTAGCFADDWDNRPYPLLIQIAAYCGRVLYKPLGDAKNLQAFFGELWKAVSRKKIRTMNSETDPETPSDMAKSPARLQRWLRRWPWLVAVVLMIVVGMVVVPAVLQYRAIQAIRAVGGSVSTDRLSLYLDLQEAWHRRMGKKVELSWIIAFEQVSTVQFSGSSVQERDLRDLKRFEGIRKLSIVDTQMREGGLPVFEKLNALESLDVLGSPVTDAGVVYLKNWHMLKTLRLSETKVTDKGLIHLKNSLNLEHLFLDDTLVTDAGLIHLKEVPRLKVISLNDTQITDAGLVHLKEMTWLEVLYLKQTKITPAGMKELQAALPNCWIRY